MPCACPVVPPAPGCPQLRSGPPTVHATTASIHVKVHSVIHDLHWLPLACGSGKADHTNQEDDAYGCAGRRAWRPGRASWASGAPDLGSAIHPGQSRRAWPKRSCGQRNVLAGPSRCRAHRGTKASAPPGVPGGIFGLEVGTAMTVDAALESTCATFRERADRGDITPAERDLLIDGAILLAMHIDVLPREDRADPTPGWPRIARPAPAGRHERHQSAA
jgi:hypothetical protein